MATNKQSHQEPQPQLTLTRQDDGSVAISCGEEEVYGYIVLGAPLQLQVNGHNAGPRDATPAQILTYLLSMVK
jgi:hypothetical protein